MIRKLDSHFRIRQISGEMFKNLCALVISLGVALLPACEASPPINYLVESYAGNYATSGSYGGDGGPATAASMIELALIWQDSVGNLFIADDGAYRVRKVDSNNIITLFAGDGGSTATFGGAATSSGLYYVRGVCGLTTGDIYLGVSAGEYVMKVSSNGIITNFAGTGVASFNSDNIQATSAALYTPTAIKFDTSGTLYLVDQNNYRVRTINSAGIVHTVAGNGVNSGCCSTGNGGLATNAQMKSPVIGLFVDTSNDFYVVEAAYMRKVEYSTSIISIFAGTGTHGVSGDGVATSANVMHPEDIWKDTVGNIYFTENSGSNRVRIQNNLVYSVAGSGVLGNSGNGGEATAAEFSLPLGLIGSTTGTLYVADSSGGNVRQLVLFAPSLVPSPAPSKIPTFCPSSAPSIQPTLPPSFTQTSTPSQKPSVIPSYQPSTLPILNPSEAPTVDPNSVPTLIPTAAPTVDPSCVPTVRPTATPTVDPSMSPSLSPTSSAASVQISIGAIAGIAIGGAFLVFSVLFLWHCSRKGHGKVNPEVQMNAESKKSELFVP